MGQFSPQTTESPTWMARPGKLHSTGYQGAAGGSRISSPPNSSCINRLNEPESVCSAMRGLSASPTRELEARLVAALAGLGHVCAEAREQLLGQTQVEIGRVVRHATG